MEGIRHRKVESVIRIDERSMESTFDTYYARLKYYAESFVSEDDAHEIVLTIFEDIWIKRNELEFENEKALKNYLYSGIRFRCIDFLRKGKVEQRAIHVVQNWQDASAGSAGEREIEFIEALAMLYAGIEELPEQFRLVVEKVIAGQSYAQISQDLGLKEVTIRGYLHKAIDRLRGKFYGNISIQI